MLSTHYYMKEIVSRPLRMPNGAYVPFERLPGDIGVIATEDPMVIRTCQAAIAGHYGGVSRIDREQYEELKKKAEQAQPQSSSAIYTGPRIAVSPQMSSALNPMPVQDQPQAPGPAVVADEPKQAAPPSITKPRTVKTSRSEQKQ